jgi:hypothetical protein
MREKERKRAGQIKKDNKEKKAKNERERERE